jgi:protein phosphatase
VFKIRFYGRSDVGRKRLTNEDSFYTSDDEQFGIVCDGMGGHQGGEIASRLAVDVLTDCVVNAGSRLFKARGRKLAHVRSLAKDLVLEWTQRANEQIFQKGGPDTPLRTRMGTTLALVLLVEDFAVCAHVGDSRIYRIRGKEAELPPRTTRSWARRAPRARGAPRPSGASS